MVAACGKRMQQAEPLSFERIGQNVDSGDVPARSVVARDQARFYRIAADGEDDGNGRGRGLRRQRRRLSAARHEHRDLAADQIGRQRRQPIILAVCIAVLDCDVPPCGRLLGHARARRSVGDENIDIRHNKLCYETREPIVESLPPTETQ